VHSHVVVVGGDLKGKRLVDGVLRALDGETRGDVHHAAGDRVLSDM
jgi:hypothetical protein